MEHDQVLPPRFPRPATLRSHLARRARLAAMPLARAAVAVLVAVVALGVLGTAARADGDPGSDVLASQSLFLPVDAHASASRQAGLASVVRSANASGFTIRVAVIAQPDDLGAVAALWRKPAAYAKFLGIELSQLYKGRLLVVMPNGFGLNWPGHPTSPELRVLARIQAGTGGGLAGTAEAAVRGLAAASGVRLAGQPSGGHSGIRTWVTLAAVLAVLAAAAVIAVAVMVRRRRGGADAWRFASWTALWTALWAAPWTVLSRGRMLAAGHRWRVAAAGALAIALAGSAGTAYAVVRARQASTEQSLRPSGIPASISTSLANEMAMDALGRQAAPPFTLSDQAGRRISLSSFRGKVVVLDFMDDRCTNVCPVVSAEFIAAHRDLGPLASKVVFIGVNANPFYRSVRDVAAFTSEQRLSVIPDWHYFTGTLPELRDVWSRYHITITAPNRNDVIHTSAIYVIDPSGRERFLADADVEVPQVKYRSNGQAYIPGGTESAWGHGIAELARAAWSGR